FIKIDMKVDNRSAQDRVIPLATALGMAVLINSPFGRNRVFTHTACKALPDFAKEIDATTWAQFALKYIVGNTTVTAAIPGIGRVDYLEDDMKAAHGRIPDEAMRKRMEEYVDKL